MLNDQMVITLTQHCLVLIHGQLGNMENVWTLHGSYTEFSSSPSLFSAKISLFWMMGFEMTYVTYVKCCLCRFQPRLVGFSPTQSSQGLVWRHQILLASWRSSGNRGMAKGFSFEKGWRLAIELFPLPPHFVANLYLRGFGFGIRIHCERRMAQNWVFKPDGPFITLFFEHVLSFFV